MSVKTQNIHSMEPVSQKRRTTGDNKKESQMHSAKWKKPDREDYIPRDSIYRKFLKGKTLASKIRSVVAWVSGRETAEMDSRNKQGHGEDEIFTLDHEVHTTWVHTFTPNSLQGAAFKWVGSIAWKACLDKGTLTKTLMTEVNASSSR